MDLSVSPLDVSQRLDFFVASKIPELSRSYVNRLCDEKKVLVNNRPKKTSYKLKLTDTVHVKIDLLALKDIPVIDIPILYEDDDCIVLDKPAGVLTHSKGSLTPEATVATFIRPRISPEMLGNRAGIVHRLDRPTSGVIICAKTQNAQELLQRQFADRKARKTYIAVVVGTPAKQKATIDMPIGRNARNPKTFHVHSKGKTAKTNYQVLSSTSNQSLLKLQPESGRTHQIRVHLSHIGHPVVGDILYGGGEAQRLLLHAHTLEITLPSKQRREFTSKIPKEFTLSTQ